MRHFQPISTSAPFLPLMLALARKPELWNQHRFRTTYTNTPHIDVDDVLIRYSDPERTKDPTNLGPVQNDHGAVWYPAAQELPETKPVILDLMHLVGAYELGRVVISRIRPGGRILPHADAAGDYVNLGDIARYHVVLQGLAGSLFHCGGETVNMRTGEVWWFQAAEEHSVENNSADDRIHLIVDCRHWR